MRLDTAEKRLKYRELGRPDYPIKLEFPTIHGIVYAKHDPSTGKVVACGYRGTSTKPDFHIAYRTTEDFEVGVAHWQAAYLEWDLNRAAAKSANHAAVCPWKVGQILKASWGYDQTNIDYYEVVAIRGKLVDVQEIGQHCIEARGPAGDTVIPFRRRRGEISTRRPQTHDGGKTWFIKFASYKYAWPWNGKPDYQTDPMFGH